MHPSSRLGRTIAGVLAAVALTACTSAPTPIGGSAAPSTPVASSAPTTAPSSGTSPIASPTAEPVESVEPIDSPEPTSEPSVTPKPIVNPTTRPTDAPATSCGTGQAGFAAAHETPQMLQFGGATLEFTSAGVGMLDGSFNADDAIPGGVGLSPKEIAVVVGPGDHVILRAKGLTLLGTTATASAWSGVTFTGGLANLTGEKTTLPWRFRTDGSLSVSAPDAVGDWAIEFFPLWQGACAHGDGTAYGRIKVR